MCLPLAPNPLTYEGLRGTGSEEMQLQSERTTAAYKCSWSSHCCCWSPPKLLYRLFFFEPARRRSPGDSSCCNSLIGRLWCCSLSVVPGGWRWRSNVMQRNDWSATQLPEKTQVRTGVARTWCTHIRRQACIFTSSTNRRMLTRTHRHSEQLMSSALNTSSSIAHLWKGKLNFTGTKPTPLRCGGKKSPTLWV